MPLVNKVKQIAEQVTNLRPSGRPRAVEGANAVAFKKDEPCGLTKIKRGDEATLLLLLPPWWR
jgi:hypothetical protein